MALTVKEEKDTVTHNASLLIAARPDRMRDSLHILLKAIPGIDIVGCADDSSSALRMVSEHHPRLVLLDTNLPGDSAFAVLQRIKANGSRSRCLVLVDDVRQKRDALAAGADDVLLRGFRAAELYEVIKKLVSGQRARGESSH